MAGVNVVAEQWRRAEVRDGGVAASVRAGGSKMSNAAS